MIKRLFDIFFSFFGLLILLPFFILIGLIIVIDSKGGIFYQQIRVGKSNKEFGLYKFRTMKPDSDKKGLLTVGGRDPRITSIGYYLRKYKLDELPQLINVFIGDMSLVGPRPEVRKYVDMYSKEQQRVLLVKPGITDYASIEYFNENELLGKSDNPEQTYINEVMPAKLKINLKYIEEYSVLTDFKIIIKTIGKIFGSH
ncbi:MAG: sugar transferase [Flavobacteriales bacterium]|nr:sugar transferase [Flavobacteriales bacterium]MCB9173412.1 sugar transferase [Flavobacteriales bacterium]